MTTDLWMLAASALLYWVLIMIAATPTLVSKGLGWGLGNRAEPCERPGWVGRALRAQLNLGENLILFAIVVLTVHVSGSANATSALGAEIFVGARVVHAVVYLVGMFGVRTLSWAVSLVGIGMMASTLF